MQKAADDTGPGGSTGRRRWIGRSLLVAGLGLGAFAVSLLATLPARIVASRAAPSIEISDFSGTVWNGQARVPGGHAVVWRVAPARSLAAMELQLTVGVTGPGTDLAGRLAVRGLDGRDVRVEALSGRAAWPLIAALAPDLPVACDAAATFEDVGLRVAQGLRAGSGVLRSDPGQCTAADGDTDAAAVPALTATLETGADGVRAVVVATEAADAPLAVIEASNDDRLVVTVLAAGAALVPGMPASSETSVEYPLPWPP